MNAWQQCLSWVAIVVAVLCWALAIYWREISRFYQRRAESLQRRRRHARFLAMGQALQAPPGRCRARRLAATHLRS